MQLLAWPQGGALRGWAAGGGCWGSSGGTPGSGLPGVWARAVSKSWEWGVEGGPGEERLSPGPLGASCPTGGTAGTVSLCFCWFFLGGGERRGGASQWEDGWPSPPWVSRARGAPLVGVLGPRVRLTFWQERKSPGGGVMEVQWAQPRENRGLSGRGPRPQLP